MRRGRGWASGGGREDARAGPIAGSSIHHIEEFSETTRAIAGYVAASAKLDRTNRRPARQSRLTLPYLEAPPPDWAEISGVPRREAEKGGAGTRHRVTRRAQTYSARGSTMGRHGQSRRLKPFETCLRARKPSHDSAGPTETTTWRLETTKYFCRIPSSSARAASASRTCPPRAARTRSVS